MFFLTFFSRLKKNTIKLICISFTETEALVWASTISILMGYTCKPPFFKQDSKGVWCMEQMKGIVGQGELK